MLFLDGEKVVTNNGDTLPILIPEISKLVDVRVYTQHVEICVDGQDMVACKQIEARLNCLTLHLVLEKLILTVDEIDSIFKLELLRENLDV